MLKLIIIRGLPYSGKTNKAIELLKQHENIIRLSKEDLARMLFCNLDKAINIENKKYIVDLFNKAFNRAILSRKSIILDDINISDNAVKYYSFIAKQNNYKVEIVNNSIDLQQCLLQDVLSNDPIGKERIKKLAINNINLSDDEFIIYDLSCVLNNDERKKLCTDLSGNIEYDNFYDPQLVSMDILDVSISKSITRDYETGFKIVIITDIPESLSNQVLKKLDHYDILFSSILFRDDLDKSDPSRAKINILKKYIDHELCVGLLTNDDYLIDNLHNEWERVILINANDGSTNYG